MAQLKDEFDWVVLGDHPGALLSGLLCAKAGKSVLFLPLFPSYLSRLSLSAQCLDPERNFLLGLNHSKRSAGLLSNCFEYMGVPVSEASFDRSVQRMAPHVLCPGVRLSLSDEIELFESELKTEVGSELTGKLQLPQALAAFESEMSRYWKGFSKGVVKENLNGFSKSKGSGGFLESLTRLGPQRKSSHRVRNFRAQFQGMKLKSRSYENWPTLDCDLQSFSGSFYDQRVSDIFSGLWYASVGIDSNHSLLVDWVQSLLMLRTGGSFKGGLTAYRKYLLGLARREGAQLPSDLRCKRIFVEDGEIVGVQVSNRGKVIEVKGGVLGSSIQHAESYIYSSGRRRKKAALKRSPAPLGWKFTLSLTVHKEAIPPALSSQVIWKEEGAPALEVEIARTEDYRLGESGNRLVFLRTSMPFSRETLEVEYQYRVASRMFRQLKEIFPFVEFHIVQMFPDLREIDRVKVKKTRGEGVEFREAYPFQSLEEIPDNLLVRGGSGLGIETGISGLYLANGESYPTLGSLGGTVAAIESCARHFLEIDFQGASHVDEFSGFFR